jgi:hypothetical protein
MTYAFSSNLGDTTTHARSVIRWVAHTYPWFNRWAAAAAAALLAAWVAAHHVCCRSIAGRLTRGHAAWLHEGHLVLSSPPP